MFVLGILTAETCGLIIVGWTTTVAGPGLRETSVRGRDRTGIRAGHVSGN